VTGLRLLLAARKSNKVRDRDGHEHLSVSIEIQDRQGAEWAERNGHAIVDVAADIKSGTVAPWDRPNLRQWVTDPARMALYDGILATRNDRLSRGCWADEARIRLWAEEHGKALVIADGPQWPPRHAGDKWQWEAMADQARREWEDIQRRNTETQRELRSRGALIGRTPWGYRIKGAKYAKTLVPSKDGKRLVPEIFRRVIDGHSLAAIAAWLTAETGRTWWPRTVGSMIRNPVYRGCQADAAGKTILRCEPLVDARTWRLAGEALTARPKRGHTDPVNRAMLSGVLECASCRAAGVESPMYRIKAGHGNTHLYYRCTGKGPGRRGCGTMIRLDAADAAVDRLIATRFDKPRTVSTVVEGNEADIAARLQANEYERAQLGQAGLDDEEEDRRRAELRAERDAIRAEPVVPDRVQETDTGERYADLWARTPVPERGPWLAENGFRVYASRTGVAIEQGDERHTASL
jgi:DNA invertase Pin-like site-specific DNA recombinase